MRKAKLAAALGMLAFVWMLQPNPAVAYSELLMFENVDYQPADHIRIVLDGQEIPMKTMPQIIGGRTYVPLRAVSEGMGLQVEWDEASQAVKAMNEEMTIIMTLDSQEALVNDQVVPLDAPLCIAEDRVLAPLRFLQENLGYHVVWDGEARLILMSRQDIGEWRYSYFEMTEPYREVEALFINGEKTARIRYNGNFHDAAVTWRREGYEETYPFKEYEKKYVGGVKTSETRYTGTNRTLMVSIQGILIANKTYTLPEAYAPGENAAARQAFDLMQADARAVGLTIYISSGYRDYRQQTMIYNRNSALYGQSRTDTFSARPGHSEHQTGMAFDLNTISGAFGKSKEGAWVRDNAHRYGFIIRYPEGKEQITGYQYEPWHVRYLGIEMAAKVHDSGLCLEEYFGIPSAYAS
jgi:D-alanyl-D-alanine carboxypeptidase